MFARRPRVVNGHIHSAGAFKTVMSHIMYRVLHYIHVVLWIFKLWCFLHSWVFCLTTHSSLRFSVFVLMYHYSFSFLFFFLRFWVFQNIMELLIFLLIPNSRTIKKKVTVFVFCVTVAYKISRKKTEDILKLLHTILYGRRGKVIRI